MAEGTHIPGAPACNEWEAQLTDAIDGLLSPEDEARFVAHKLTCPGCADLYEEVRKGRQWLEFLSPEPEPPAGLLEQILATTGPGTSLGQDGNGLPAAAGVVPAWVPPAWQQTGFLARMRASAHPRMLMTAAMAFFSIALTLSLTGVQLTNLQLSGLRPRMVRAYMERQLNMASVPVVRYYDHLQIVHEVEARVREFRNENESEDNGDDNGVEQPQQTQPAGPGESRILRTKGNWEAVCIENHDLLETSLEFPIGSKHTHGQSRGYMVRKLEGNSPWIA